MIDIKQIEDFVSDFYEDKYPFLMFPIRLETRFMKVEIPKKIKINGEVQPNLNMKAEVVGFLEQLDGIKQLINSDFDVIGEEQFLSNVGQLVSQAAKIKNLVKFENRKINFELSKFDSEVRNQINKNVVKLSTGKRNLDDIKKTAISNQSKLDKLNLTLAELTPKAETDEVDAVLLQNIEVLNDAIIAEKNKNYESIEEFKKAASGISDKIYSVSSLASSISSVNEQILNDVVTKNNELTTLKDELTANIESETQAVELNLIELDSKITSSKNSLNELKNSVGELKSKTVSARVTDIPDETSPEIIGLKGGKPIVLNEIVDELWVRIYPDDINITAHERLLQESEIDAAVKYYLNLWNLGYSKDNELGLWRTFVDAYGARRAAWILKVMHPVNFKLAPKVIELTDSYKELIKNGLTSDEIQDGKSYWEGLLNHIEVILKKGNAFPVLDYTFEFLESKYGTEKAIIIINLTKPTNFEAFINGEIGKANIEFGKPALNSDFVFERGYLISDFSALMFNFPDDTKKEEQAWIDAAYTDSLPTNFIITTYSDESDTAGTRHVGEKIPEKLITSIHADSDKADSISLNNSDEIEFEKDLEWLVDFEEAVKVGMALRIPLKKDEATGGFYRVFATGVKFDYNHEQGKQLIENLIESHHYSEEGFAVVPQGTATNNTQETEAGLSSFDFGSEVSYKVEREGDLFEDVKPHEFKPDGQWLAEGLGIESKYLKNIQYTDLFDISTATNMNEALFMGSINTYLEFLIPEIFQQNGLEDIRQIREYFTKNVSARGFIPSVKVGDQPYGILATSSTLRREYGWVGSQSQFMKDFEVYLEKFYDWWKQEADKEVNIRNSNYSSNITLVQDYDGGVNYLNRNFRYAKTDEEKLEVTKRRFLNILGLNPNSVEHHIRYGVAGGAMTNWGGVLQLSQNSHLRQNILFFKNIVGIGGLETSPIVSLLWGIDSSKREDLGADGSYLGGIVQEGKLSETEQLDKIFDSEQLNYIEKLLKSPFSELRSQLYSGIEQSSLPKSLLYLMLRHSLLLQYFDTCMDVLDKYFYYEFEAEIKKMANGKIQIILKNNINNRVFTSNAIVKIFENEKEIASVQLTSHAGNLNYTKTLGDLIKSAKDPVGIRKIRIYDNYGFQIRSTLGGVLHKDPTDVNPASSGEIINQIKHMIKPMEGLIEKDKISPINFLQKNIQIDGIEEVRKYLDRVLESIKLISNIPTAKLERAFIEHLDLFTYRLDAWKQSLVNNRLFSMRKENPLGTYVGAFGWVEDLRPKNSLDVLPNKDYPEGYDPEDIKLYRDEKNEGYIHAPSINHGVASAVLKSAYASIADSNNDSLFAVNLSSQRVRKALAIFEGIRGGQTMAEVLGYQFERSLHDYYFGIELEQYLYEIREKFPLQNNLPENGPTQTVKPRNSVDGLALIQSGTPLSGITIPANNTDPNRSKHQDALLELIDDVKSTFDAVKDLAISDGIYSAAMGNMENPSAMMNALSEGAAPPDPQIINTPRDGYRLTNKIVSIANTESPVTGRNLRALTEPYVNDWINSFLGDLTKIIIKVNYDDTDYVYSIKDLNIDAIDLLYLSKKISNGGKEFDSFIAYHVISTNSLANDKLISISYSDRDGTGYENDYSVKMLSEVISLLERLYKVVTDSKYITAEDLRSPNVEKIDEANPGLIDIEELERNIDFMMNDSTYGVAQIKSNLDDVIANESNKTSDDFRSSLISVFRLGISNSIPVSSFGDSPELKRDLLEQALNVQTVLQEKIDKYTSIEYDSVKDSISVNDRVEILINKIKSIFGEDFRILPRFNWEDYDGFNDSYSNTKGLLDYHKDDDYVMEDWLNGVSHVKERVKVFNDCFLLADTLGAELNFLKPVQLPHDSKDYWMAVEYPDFEYDEAKICYAVHSVSEDLNDSLLQCGFMIEEWVETIPNKEITTAVTYHYDEPIAEAPNALLLAVPSEIKGKWTLDDILNIMKSTYDDMKLRAVEPDILDFKNIDHDYNNIYSKIMPPIVTSALPDQRNFTLDFGENIGSTLNPPINYQGENYDSEMLNNEGSITI